MGRSLEIEDGNLVVRYDGIDRLATLVGNLVVPRELIESVEIGLPDAPSVWTPKRVGTAVPFRNTRRGRFWRDGKRYFLDLRNPDQALVVRLRPGARFDVVAIETPEAEQLREQLS